MNSEVQELLLKVNREFYQSFAAEFAASRSEPRPGTLPLLDRVNPTDSILDLGCGHGTLANALNEHNHHGPYLGLDESQELLDLAREQSRHPAAVFRQADLAQPGWGKGLGREFNWTFLLAVLHHIPGVALRRQLVAEARELLVPTGRAVVSVWNFPADSKWEDRQVAWSSVGLKEDQLEPGDALLDWRQGGESLRYVHHFTVEELTGLAEGAGFEVRSTHHAGGASGQLNRLQIWQRSE